MRSAAFALSEAIGVLPFRDGKLQISLCIRFLVLCFFIIGTGTYTMFSSNMRYTGPEAQAVQVRLAVSVIQFSLSPLSAVASAGFVTLQRRNLRRAQQILSTLNPEGSHNWQIYTSSCLFTTALLLSLYVRPHRFYNEFGRITTFLAYHTPMLVLILVASQFTYCMALAKESYTIVIDMLPFVTRQSQIRTLLIKMRSIDRACGLINKAYSLSLLLIFVALFCLITSQSYYMFTIAISKHQSRQFIEQLLNILVYFNIVILLTFEVWKISWISSSTMEKVTIFNKALYKMCLTRKDQLCKNPWVKFHLINKCCTPITAHRFFSIELPLLQSMLGATTTYLVIMVQFQLSEYDENIPKVTKSP